MQDHIAAQQQVLNLLDGEGHVWCAGRGLGLKPLPPLLRPRMNRDRMRQFDLFNEAQDGLLRALKQFRQLRQRMLSARKQEQSVQREDLLRRARIWVSFGRHHISFLTRFEFHIMEQACVTLKITRKGAWPNHEAVHCVPVCFRQGWRALLPKRRAIRPVVPPQRRRSSLVDGPWTVFRDQPRR